MNKRMKFGPGHPAYDAQLQLFPDIPDPLRDGAVFQIRDIPCPACVGGQVHVDLQSPIPIQNLPETGELNCPGCKGSGIRRLRMKRVAGRWWDPAERAVIIAESREEAWKKTNGRAVVPFLVERVGPSD